MSQFSRAHVTSYWCSIVAMAVSSVVSEIFNVEKCWSWNPGQGSLKVIESGSTRQPTVSCLCFIVTLSLRCAIFLDIRLVTTTVIMKPVLGVTQGHRNRHVSIYDILLTFHSNHEPISYRFRDKRRFRSKIAKFSHPPCILRPCWMGYPRNWGTGAQGHQTSDWVTGPRKKFRDIFSCLDTMHQCARRTDRHWVTAKTALCRLCIVLHGKNEPRCDLLQAIQQFYKLHL